MTVKRTPALDLALNACIQDRMLSAARQSFAFGGGPLDTKRPRSDIECGFPENPGFDEFYRVYKRHGVGSGALMQLLDKVWQDNPWLIEGEDEYDETRDETQWEREVKRLFKKKNIFCAIKETDKRRMVGGYAGLIIQVKDSKQWNQELGNVSAAAIVKFIPAWRGSLEVITWDTNVLSPTYGEPLMYTYREHSEAVGDSPRLVEIHPSRIVIFGSITEPESLFSSSLNALISLSKVTGGSGESYIKAAARALHIGFDKDAQIDAIARAHGVPVSELQTLYDEVTRDVNRGIDTTIITQGGTVTPLSSTVPDPEKPFEVNLQEVAAGMRIPSTIITGRQTGTLASSEDVKAFNRRGQAYRLNDASPDIRKVVDWLMDHGVITAKEDYEVMWSDLTESTDSERLANALTMSDINSKSLASGDRVFSPEEIRTQAGHENTDELDPLPDVDPTPEEQTVPQ